jgi:K+-sensing histidine kinase KdpD
MGLASCREIVEAHRGRIRVESAPGRGTAMTIRLPVLDAAAERRSACGGGSAQVENLCYVGPQS